MKKLFIHDPVFRILSPLFGGSLVYLMVLLVNNNVGQLDEQFLGQELYLCIGLSYIIQEFSRYFLVILAKRQFGNSVWWTIVIQVTVSILFTCLIVSLILFYYYKLYLGFTPSASELILFNVIFTLIAISYVSLYISHRFLYQINTDKISAELEKKSATEEDYRQFVRGINPPLLFKGLEALIMQMKSGIDEDPDELLDSLSMVYRYMLANRTNEPVAFEKEAEAMNNLVALFGFLPYVRVTLALNVENPGVVVPGTFLQLLQEFVRITIPSVLGTQKIEIYEQDDYMILEMNNNDRLDISFDKNVIRVLNQQYNLYSDETIRYQGDDKKHQVYIPKLLLK